MSGMHWSKGIGIGLLLGANLLLVGCIRAPFVPPTGWVFTQVKAPLDVDYSKTSVPAKSGKAEAICVLGLVSVGDVSTQTAAAAGGIGTIDHADYEYFNILGLFQKTTVIVYGN